jgi:hypothetical protein
VADALEATDPLSVVADTVPATAERTACVNDVDAYVVPLRDFERLVVQGTFAPGDLDLDLQVFDASGTVLRKQAPTSPSGARTLTYDAQGDETVVVRASGRRNTQGSYRIAFARENQVRCVPDGQEPNDTQPTASALPAPADVLTICDSDQDYFKLDGIAGKKLVVTASFPLADGDLDLQVLGVDGNQILATGDASSDDEKVEVVLPVDGVYTIRVFSLTSGARARYNLRAELLAP